MVKKRSVIEEALEEVKNMRKTAVESAKIELTEAMAPVLERVVSRRLNEELGGGGDPPADYDEDGEQKRLGKNLSVDGETGDDLADEGDGPAIIEDEELEIDDEEEDVLEDEDEFSVEDDEEEDELFSEEDDDELEMDSDEVLEDDEELEIDDDEEDVIEVVEDDELEIDDDDEEEVTLQEKRSLAKLKRECINLRKENRKLNRALHETVSRMKEVNTYNARLAAFNKLSNKTALTVEEKARLLKRFDRCKNIDEVKSTYATLSESLSMLNKKQRKIVRKDTKKVSNSLNEEMNSDYRRLQELAQII